MTKHHHCQIRRRIYITLLALFSLSFSFLFAIIGNDLSLASFLHPFDDIVLALFIVLAFLLLCKLFNSLRYALIPQMRLYQNATSNPHKHVQCDAVDSHQLHSLERILHHTNQKIILWRNKGTEIEIYGSLPKAAGVPAHRDQFLDFKQWMTPKSAETIRIALNALKKEGRSFEIILETEKNGVPFFLYASGRVSGFETVLCLREANQHIHHYQHLKREVARTQNKLQTLQNLLNAISQPIWLYNHNKTLLWANHAYYKLNKIPEDTEPIFINPFPEIHLEAENTNPTMHKTITPVIDGERRIVVVTSTTSPSACAAFAEDITEKEYLRRDLKRVIQGYAETFDQISTSVTIFDPNMKLEFFNQAFAALWPIDIQFLETHPDHTLLLDHLREKGLVNEQPNWRQWKEELFEAYRALTPQTHLWHLPDGRTLHIVAHPHPQGGVTWLYEDLTEKLKLEARYNALIRIQGETLDNLLEGVAVFGSDGKIKLSNPAFKELWSLPAALTIEGTHIRKVEPFCLTQLEGRQWQDIAASITEFSDKREEYKGRMDLHNGTILDYIVTPLPQGQTMLTFANMTDSIMISRALRERNEALEISDRLRNDFVQHISYQLRTPLTNIIGFVDLLRLPDFGLLTPQQQEYVDIVTKESHLLHQLVDDILDLATVDAGIMELNIQPVDIMQTMNHAVERMKEKLLEKNIVIQQSKSPELDYFYADHARIQQIFVNLLSNAINGSPAHSRIEFTAEHNKNKNKNIVCFSIKDQGSGIPEILMDNIFKRFTSYTHHGYIAGVGLGLSIVKTFVELHKGTITIDSVKNQGTCVSCQFPLNHPATAPCSS